MVRYISKCLSIKKNIMKKSTKFSAFILIAIIVFASCKKDKPITATPTKWPPFANAGTDKFILLPEDSIVLTGKGRDADGYIVSYEWLNVSGPASFTMVNTDSAQAKVRNMVRGVYEFELKVTDNDKLFATDRILVYVLNSINDPLNYAGLGYWDY